MKIIEERKLLNDGGIVICEYESQNIITNLEIIKSKQYGNCKIDVLKYNN